jgi:Prenyltransferase and squalene oxidase repeat
MIRSVSQSWNRRSMLRVLAGGALGASALACGSVCHAEDFPARTDLDALYDKDVDEAIRKGLALLVSRQNPDGSFLSNDWGRDAGVCALVGLALLSRGVRSGFGAPGKCLQLIGNYLSEHAQESGMVVVAGSPSHGQMYGHGFATLFLSELYGTTPRPYEADLSVTVCQVMALRAARNAGIGVAKETIDKAVDYIRRSQNADGGYMYQLTGGASRFPLTAAAVVALYNAGIYEGEEIDSAIAYLQANLSANSSLERNSFFYYAHYYSAQAFWLRGGPAWDQWYGRLRKILLSLRNAQGGWFDYNSIEYGTAMSCLILNMPRTVLPIFQR